MGAAPARILFEKGHISRVTGVELSGGRLVVVKVRPRAERIAGCVAVQRHLFARGFPCPEPLAGPAPIGTGGECATAEALIPAGTELRAEAGAPSLLARLLAALIRLAPAPSEIPREPGIWPRPDDLDIDLDPDARRPSDWIDEIGRRVRARLSAFAGDPVVGHADWESHNVRWRRRSPLAVDDWDSVASLGEPAIAGAAAAVFPSSSDGRTVAATIAQTEAFLGAYRVARDRRWSTDAEETCWAAGMWVLSYNARKETLGGGAGYVRHLDREAEQRLRRAGA